MNTLSFVSVRTATFAALAASALLAGCAAPEPPPGVSVHRWERDRYQCIGVTATVTPDKKQAGASFSNGWSTTETYLPPEAVKVLAERGLLQPSNQSDKNSDCKGQQINTSGSTSNADKKPATTSPGGTAAKNNGTGSAKSEFDGGSPEYEQRPVSFYQ